MACGRGGKTQHCLRYGSMNGVNIFMHEYYFKMGEFATICGVKKSTLVHYADIGLFKPHHIGENGYYYYSPTQIYVYEVIDIMRRMSIPLEEIKAYLENQDVMNCREVLKRNLELLKAKRKEMEHIERIIENTLSDVDNALNQKQDEIEVITQEEDHYFFVYKMPYRTEKAAYDLGDARAMIKRCKDSWFNSTLNVSEIVLQEHVLDGSFKKTYGGFRIDHKIEDENIMIRPAGQYVTVCSKSGGNKIPCLYRKLKKYADEHGYQVCGNAYEEDQLSYITEHDRENYLVRCYLHVRPIDTGNH